MGRTPKSQPPGIATLACLNLPRSAPIRYEDALIFLTIYIILDGAGTKDVWFNLTRGAVSLAASYLVSLIVINTLAPDDRK